MGTFLNATDLDNFVTIDPAKVDDMIDDAEALAVLHAPCITAEDFINGAAVKAILRGVILRWHESGNGAVQSQQTGPFGVTLDTRQERRGMFWPTEIDALRNLCSTNQGSVYTINLAGPGRGEGYWSQPNTWVPI